MSAAAATERQPGGGGVGAKVIALGRAALRARVVRFAAVGASGVVVNLAGLWLLAGVLHVRDVAASAIAIEASIAWNFLLNNAFTYRDCNARAQASLAERVIRYNLVSLVGLALQLGTFVLLRMAVLHLLHREALGPLRYPVQCVGIVLATAWNFAGNLHFTWRQAAAAPASHRSAGEAA